MVSLHRTSAAVLSILVGCGKAESSGMTQAWNPDESSGAAESGDADEAGTNDPSQSSDPSDDAPVSCDDPCDAPPSDCQLAPGECLDGACEYDNALAGTPCITDCPEGGHCDADGMCICGSGGGDCESDCTAGPHQSAACDGTGQCIRTCESPWEDCDADPSNGCEVPVGMAHQCDISGLRADGGGCWTAYCGSMSGDGIFDFGTYHCIDCSTCEEPGGGQCHWCNHDTGNWFPQEACSCGAEFLDLACS